MSHRIRNPAFPPSGTSLGDFLQNQIMTLKLVCTPLFMILRGFEINKNKLECKMTHSIYSSITVPRARGTSNINGAVVM